MMDVARCVNRKQPPNCPPIPSRRFVNASGQLNQHRQRSITPTSPVETQGRLSDLTRVPPTATPSADLWPFDVSSEPLQG